MLFQNALWAGRIPELPPYGLLNPVQVLVVGLVHGDTEAQGLGLLPGQAGDAHCALVLPVPPAGMAVRKGHNRAWTVTDGHGIVPNGPVMGDGPHGVPVLTEVVQKHHALGRLLNPNYS